MNSNWIETMKTGTSATPADRKQWRDFGLVFGTGLVVMFGLLLPWLADRPFPLWPWITAAVFIILALACPPALRPLNALWLKFGHVLGWINTRIILGVVYFVVFLPTSLVLRMLHRDPLQRQFDASAASYRVPSKAASDKQMERPF
jgi:hypothetical protein